ncbi:aminopeptidase [Phycisphaera mikurensis]|uniref:Peptidase M29 family protein n=1 Tax=Phycisphaera mikurensis (strain NBRC 102666 / KCTC 22515 / FYK2301M01) TaxID=1142394 RepID=I0IGY3_PHYMF|nr:aminopeptidase [Phycisphaera mikurensis]MBB6440778.1 aminopeptidase [Phycisphaera mikurensis]BAM04521.1 peptidase M29 family protein [Phycisphaera mikurensis NBRC 102666]
MTDPRITQLAHTLLHHSTKLQPGEHLLIEAFDLPEAMVVALIEGAKRLGAHPHVALRSGEVQRALLDGADAEQLDTWAANDLDRMKRMDAYIGMRGAHNSAELAGLSESDAQKHARLYQTPVHGEQRVKHTRWCVLRWPTPSMAQAAGRSTRDFEDFYFSVCNADYPAMAEAVKPLERRMAAAEHVRIVGPGDTDLSFSIAGVPAVACTGGHNVPDGECFSAPVAGSANGVIAFNTPTRYLGKPLDRVRLELADGVVTRATAAAGQEALDAILATDEGARSFGEFAVGFHPVITEPMGDILFDEKIGGSVHLALGRAYEAANNGNRSDIHWDLVLIQDERRGGGELHLDGELVRKDGLFVVEDLLGLNPGELGKR